MTKPVRVEYVLSKPSAPSWWRRNRHLVLLVVGLIVGAWLVDGGPGGAAAPAPDQPRPARSTVSGDR
ncbi:MULTISPECIES: hypothetical protein [Streptomyces]|uniref:hypothetical protein n=1 Tax=Streptomyces TaxID=1883 RepID=UPI001E2F0BB4|nr:MULTISPECIES: hypothetical protein [Streptomyces]UFQ18895.1 hypothetical protein J2N69_30110 [Streptomyces huasconensis]WCL88512.1 hypothetical protein PPN52_30075 [Streptomyces sp. JCM 35825]